MRLQETYIMAGHTPYRYHYLCHYLPLTAGTDTLSRSLMKFKRGAQPDLDAWIDCALTGLSEEPPDPNTVILRALGHRETTPSLPDLNPGLLAVGQQAPLPVGQQAPLSVEPPAPPFLGRPSDCRPSDFRPSSLNLLGQSLAAGFQCKFLPTLLSKSCETLSNKTLNRKEREHQLKDVYSACGPLSASLPHDTPFLLLDDILTTGATIRAIIEALGRQFTTPTIRVFTLARAFNDPLHHPVPLRGRIYTLREGSGWVSANSF